MLLQVKGKGKGKDSKGKICYKFRDTGECDTPNCPYEHVTPAAPAKGKGKSRSKSAKRGRGNSPAKGKGKGRSRSGSSDKRDKSKTPCKFFKTKSCSFDDNCEWMHAKKKHAAPATNKDKKKKNKTEKQ